MYVRFFVFLSIFNFLGLWINFRKGPVILVEPLEGPPACPALQTRHSPPGGGGLTEVISHQYKNNNNDNNNNNNNNNNLFTHQGVRGATRSGQEVLGPHGHMPTTNQHSEFKVLSNQSLGPISYKQIWRSLYPWEGGK